MGVWRNWYTRTTQNRVPQGLRVRPPPRPPTVFKIKRAHNSLVFFIFWSTLTRIATLPYCMAQWEDCSMNQELLEARELAAHAIFRTGSCLVDLDDGFTLSVHEKLPEAPRSPFHLNLHREGVKEGTLGAANINTIGRSMYLLGKERELFTYARSTCSIPAAGDPYLDTITNELEGAGGHIQRYWLKKFEIDGNRAFKLPENDQFGWEDTLMIDALVASLHTNEQAMKPIAGAGGHVSDLLVFLNQSTDASKKLAFLGVRLHAVWGFEDLMEWALARGYLKRKQYEAVVEYPGQLEAYKRSVNYV